MPKPAEDKRSSQYFAVLTNTRSVGVMGDGRTYDYTLALRAVTTSDFMTADWARIPYEVLDKISVRIVNEVHGINRIVLRHHLQARRQPSSGSEFLKLRTRCGTTILRFYISLLITI